MFSRAYEWLVTRPLRELFMKGPPLGAFGFWMSMKESDICAAMTRTTSELWDENPAHCRDVIESRFESVHVVVRTFMTWLTLFMLANAVLRQAVQIPARLVGGRRVRDV